MASGDCNDERFAEAEERAERALYRNYRVAGEALRQIRDEERPCWVPVYRTWERYLHERWEISRQHANYLIQAAEVAADVSSQDDGQRLPLRHAALLHRFKSPDVRRELAAKIGLLNFPDAQRHVIAAVRKARGESPPQPMENDPTEDDALTTLRGICAQCRALDISAAVQAISRLEAGREKILEEIDFAWAHLRALNTMVRQGPGADT